MAQYLILTNTLTGQKKYRFLKKINYVHLQKSINSAIRDFAHEILDVEYLEQGKFHLMYDYTDLMEPKPNVEPIPEFTIPDSDDYKIYYQKLNQLIPNIAYKTVDVDFAKIRSAADESEDDFILDIDDIDD